MFVLRLEICRKHLPAARVFYISFMLSNGRRVLSPCNTRLRHEHEKCSFNYIISITLKKNHLWFFLLHHGGFDFLKQNSYETFIYGLPIISGCNRLFATQITCITLLELNGAEINCRNNFLHFEPELISIIKNCSFYNYFVISMRKSFVL